MIQNDYQYNAIMKRIDELLEIVDDSTPVTDNNYIELDILSGMVEKYEQIHYPISKPNLAEVIKLRMHEMNLTQAKVSEMLGVSPSRVSEYLTGKSEPTLKVARAISQKLNISAGIVLGV